MSRIFVEGLPKHTTKDRLKEIFSQKGEVTDVQILRTPNGTSRHIGFIGYRTDEEAQGAIKYFDNSFLGTSKIHCEVALEVGDPDIPRSRSQRSKQKKEKSTYKNNKISDATLKKSKKNVANINDNDYPERQEYLQVMQPRTKSKLWANDVVTSTVNKIEKDGDDSRYPGEKNQRKTFDGLCKDRRAKKKDSVNEERPVKSPNVPQHEVISDMDYFISKIKKDWSDPEDESGDDDGIGIGLEQEHEDNDDEEVSCGSEDSDATEGNRQKKGIKEHSEIPMDKVQLLTVPENSVFKDCNGEFMNSENITTNTSGENEVPLTGRLFVHNLPYVATEDEVSERFRKFGNVEVHLVINSETKRSKGYAFVCYKDPKEAAKALEELDHSIFQGRVLHVGAAKLKESSPSQDSGKSQNKPKTFKRRREEEKKISEADGNSRAWSSLYMRSDTIVENMTRKYKISKSELLDREADDLAVRLALGETQVIAETKEALMNAGVNVTSLEEFASGKSKALEKSNHVLLVKNLPYSSTESELFEMFSTFGSVDKIIFPPTRTLALVIFLEPAEAREAFRGFSYKKYKDVPLYLEWAPSNILSQDLASNGDNKKNMVVDKDKLKKVLPEHQVLEMSDGEIDPDRVESRTLYVKNLNFKSTGEGLRKHISENMKDGKIRSVKILQHVKNGKNVSTGFGFVEFDSVETASHVCQELQGTTLDGHALIVEICRAKKSEKVSNKADNGRSSTKIIVKNVPFEATAKELRQLFSSFGQVKSVRLPFRNEMHRGFAFVEFVTKQEAQNARKALSNTHFYGRHLVLGRAKERETLEELRAKTAAQFTNDEDGYRNPAKLSKKRNVGLLFKGEDTRSKNSCSVHSRRRSEDEYQNPAKLSKKRKISTPFLGRKRLRTGPLYHNFI